MLIEKEEREEKDSKQSWKQKALENLKKRKKANKEDRFYNRITLHKGIYDNVFFGDFETSNVDEGLIKMGCLLDKDDNYFVFNYIEELDMYFRNLETGTYLCLFHNLSFDGNALLRHLTSPELNRNPYKLVNKFETSKKVKKQIAINKDGDDIISMQLKRKNKKDEIINVFFTCSYKKTGLSIDNLGAMIGENKKTFEKDYDDDEFYNFIIPNIDPNDKDEDYYNVEKYIKNDCYIAKKALTFLNEILVKIDDAHENKFLYRKDDFERVFYIDFFNCYSLPQLVYQMLYNWLWNNNQKEYLKNFKINKDTYDLFNNENLKLYTGGFTNYNAMHVCKNNVPDKDGKIVYIDINSSYPNQMTKPLPITPLLKVDKISNKPNKDYVIKAKIDFEIRKELKGQFSFIRKTREQTIQNFISSGTDKEVAFWKDEWELINKYYNIYKIHYIEYYECSTSNFINEFIQIFYEMKLSKDKNIKAVAKLLLNSLYGKFGQKPIFTSDIFIDENDKDYEMILDAYENEKIINERYIVDVKRNETINGLKVFGFKNHSFKLANNYQIASRITSYARVQLWNLCDVVGWDNVFYMDTDSIVFKCGNDFDFSKIDTDDSKLGYWKVEEYFKEFRYLSVAKKYSGLTINDEYKQASSGINKSQIKNKKKEWHNAMLNKVDLHYDWYKNTKEQGKYGLIIKPQQVNIYAKLKKEIKYE